MNRQGRLQFRPPFEEVRARYFREMKRFISIPNQFKGVSAQGEELIFGVMIDRNASGFLTIFSKAEDLFSRLQAIQHKFKVPEQQIISQLSKSMRIMLREVYLHKMKQLINALHSVVSLLLFVTEEIWVWS